MSIDKELLDQLMEGRSSGDLFGKDGILAELTKALAERALTAEMEEHLGGERAEGVAEGKNHPPNRRNGSSQKTVTTDSGKVILDRECPIFCETVQNFVRDAFSYAIGKRSSNMMAS